MTADLLVAREVPPTVFAPPSTACETTDQANGQRVTRVPGLILDGSLLLFPPFPPLHATAGLPAQAECLPRLERW